MLDFIQINPKDNVAVAIKEVEGILPGHKKALSFIEKDEKIIKYGNPIGRATCDIKQGEWVHTHNLKTNLGEILEYAYAPHPSSLKPAQPVTFAGYKRQDGKVGVRNEIWVIPTVGCVNDIAKIVVDQARSKFGDQVDGIYCFTHPYGCSQLGEDHLNTQTILADLAVHPNAGGVLIMGLGCENNTIESFKKVLGTYDENRIDFIVCQEVEDEVHESLVKIEKLVGYASRFHREEVASSALIIGLKCGGSDGLSGITANPLLGQLSDRLISQGGSTILTEVPEMFGAETLLMNRCINDVVFSKTVALINDFKDYFIRSNQVIYENPSPGNKLGGITTLEDKSLGCTQKSGSAPIMDVLKYGQRLNTKGLNLLEAPGNDLVATTALVAAGAQIILFTTGRGTPFGAPSPTIKVSTQTALYEKKKNWIDFNAGTLMGGESMEDVTNRFYEYVIAIASGTQKTRAEEQNIKEIAIFKQGITL